MTLSYLDFAVDLAQRAGEIMTTNFRLGMTKTWKDDGSPLTVSDLMINDIVVKAVAQKFPEHGVVGEESSSRDGSNREWVWICDPIDGTVPFSHGVPTFVFSLALVHNGEPVVAVVNDPMSERLYTAVKGEGAFVNGERAHVTSVEKIDTLVIDFEDPKRDSVSTGAFRARLKQRGVLVTTLWSAVFSGSRVVTGEFAATVCNEGHVWDAAALALLVTEAGGKVTDLRGEPLKLVEPLHGFVVSNGDIHDALIDELVRTLD